MCSLRFLSGDYNLRWLAASPPKAGVGVFRLVPLPRSSSEPSLVTEDSWQRSTGIIEESSLKQRESNGESRLMMMIW